MNDESDFSPVSPGFMVVHGNHAEALRDLMSAWMARYPLAPLEDEWVLVQSNGVAQWLRLSLARDEADGGVGIAAALQTELPSRFMWRAYRTVLGAADAPLTSPFDKSLLVWRLVRLLPSLLSEDVFAPLRRFLENDADLRKRSQLAERLADLFDQYQVYRADWLAAWADGKDEFTLGRGQTQAVPEALRWQPRLWRALREDVGPASAASSRASVHQRFMTAMTASKGRRPLGLPRRLTVFGVSSLPQQFLEALAALGRWVQVLMCVHNPCEHDWSHIMADKDLLRMTHQGRQGRQKRRQGSEKDLAEEDLHAHAQPLLAAWGKQGRDLIGLLDLHDEREAYAQRFAAMGQRIDCFDANARDTLLRQLQDDIRDLRPIAETQALWPGVQPKKDASIRFHVTHGPQREVEVLHDELLAALAADDTLKPRDVIVMMPDVGVYAPHIQAVFGLLDAQDARYIPYAIVDQSQRRHDPLLSALEKLLTLPRSRLAVTDVLALLDVPAVRARFAIEAEQLPLLRRWIGAAQIRWGLHAEQRSALGLLAQDAQNNWSWDVGLQRLLLGYAVGVGEGDGWQGLESLDEVGGLEAALLGPLTCLLQTLDAHWRALATPAVPAVWGERLRALLADCFLATQEGDSLTLQRLEDALQAWLEACESAALTEALPLSVVGAHWLAQLDVPTLNQPFMSGGVTFATLMPMRAIPFRVVALLGMNDGDYPRSRVPMDFDLMRLDIRPGDRSRREDDRYLFLEALLSARERLHISWVGRSIQDQSERTPSVLVAQLRDHLAAGWRLEGDASLSSAQAGGRLLEALTVAHRLQPFHPAYFTKGGDARLFSYAREWRVRTSEALTPTPLPEGEGLEILPLRRLTDFLKDPVRAFFRWRLGVHFDADVLATGDQEPFALDHLQRWRLQDELIRVQKAAVGVGASRQEMLAAHLNRLARRGELPAGGFATLIAEELAEPMAAAFERYTQALADWPQVLPDEAIDHLDSSASSHPSKILHLVDELGDLRANVEGARCRLLLDSNDLVKKGKLGKDRGWAYHKIAPFWVEHVCAHLCNKALTTRIIGKTGDVTLPPLTAEEAQAYWHVLRDAWQQGLRRPLPFALRSALAWLSKIEDGAEDASAWEAARARYEDHAPDFGKRGERDSSPYLARAFPTFEALWSQGEFAAWSRALLQPVLGGRGGWRKTA